MQKKDTAEEVIETPETTEAPAEVETAEASPEEETTEAPAKTEEEDHAANEADSEIPVPAEPRRDGNGALIVN